MIRFNSREAAAGSSPRREPGDRCPQKSLEPAERATEFVRKILGSEFCGEPHVDELGANGFLRVKLALPPTSRARTISVTRSTGLRPWLLSAAASRLVESDLHHRRFVFFPAECPQCQVSKHLSLLRSSFGS